MSYYSALAIDIAESRGYDDEVHAAALAEGNIDAISLTHPANWLTEDEVEDGILSHDCGKGEWCPQFGQAFKEANK